ncbi:bifunctional enoyl-CoA hydratase/phosphate acetyltransferase [Paracoccus albus]|uniref:bifunctional enoyl-CoA hydratase/phosphate acetyltransferase n=1 Tax=Paracoccus albus TaxID=3017784 RepID=UPI0022F08852|nr:bifunctional enoyl-CoA hydratase/phosphate acetyltransferase [Paracoccus albus]WBU60228.1 bifunctional enoyl-CoA hydratase/phosphate acetyltransferase [Paracoccus albus]
MQIENKTFDELQIGDSAELRRLITPDDLIIFATASGNYNTMHLPGFDTDGDGKSEEVAPGMFTASLIAGVLGSMLPGPGTLYRNQTLSFMERAHAGEELLARVTVVDKQAGGLITLRTEVIRASDDAVIVNGEAQVMAPETKFVAKDIHIPGLLVQRHRHFDALIEQAAPLPALITAVVCPVTEESLNGALLAADDSIITPILIGNAAKIQAAAKSLGRELTGIEIIDEPSDTGAAQMGCQLARDGRANAVMKGHLHTDDLLRAMVDKETGLRTGRRFTHVFVMDVPGEPEPLLVTDAAINISPDLKTKVDITQNAIELAVSLGLEPRAGILSAVETVNPDIQSSVDAALLSKMADRGQIKGGAVDGPLAMDNAVDMAAARTKGLKGAVAGRANILVVPGIDAGNMLAKQLSYISHAEAAGLVLGAQVPVILNSRSDGAMSRLASCAVAAIHHFSQQGD